MVVAAHHGFHMLNIELGTLTPIIDPESHLPNNRFNDGKWDAQGRFWAGTMSLVGEKNAGALYCLEADLSVKKY